MNSLRAQMDATTIPIRIRELRHIAGRRPERPDSEFLKLRVNQRVIYPSKY